jgi:hypothetical protein
MGSARSASELNQTPAGRHRVTRFWAQEWYAFRVSTLSLKHRLQALPWVVASAAIVVGGCGSAGQKVVRSDASRRFSCPESRIEVEDWGPHTARASGCGQSQVYSCQQSRGAAQTVPQPSPLLESEARNPMQDAAPCSWVPSD